MPGPLATTGRLVIRNPWLYAGALAFGLVAARGRANPAEPPAAASDWQLTLKARNTLWDDQVFEKLNLGVTVRDAVATLNGAVPSAAVAEQAVKLLKGIPGVKGVVNETYVPPFDDPRTRAMPHPVTTARPPEAVAPVRPKPPAAQAVTAVAPPAPLPPVAPPPGPQTLGEQIDQLRQRDRRFHNVRAEIRDGRVTLRGTVARPQDAWEFAAAVRRLPGVVGVVQGIATNP
jgi:osmotically-inducible protein OsmY